VAGAREPGEEESSWSKGVIGVEFGTHRVRSPESIDLR
jgi:hypothetical protein